MIISPWTCSRSLAVRQVGVVFEFEGNDRPKGIERKSGPPITICGYLRKARISSKIWSL